MPTVLSVVIIGFIWNLILNPLWGVSKTILNIFQLGFLYKPWLGLASTALPTVALISVWQFIGIPMILSCVLPNMPTKKRSCGAIFKYFSGCGRENRSS